MSPVFLIVGLFLVALLIPAVYALGRKHGSDFLFEKDIEVKESGKDGEE